MNEPYYIFYQIAMVLSLLFSLWVMVIAWRRRHISGALPLLALSAATFVWTLGFFLESHSTTLERQLFFNNMGYIGSMSVPVAWFLFGIYGLFHGMTEAVKKALVADLVVAERRGSAYGVHSFISKLAKLPASLILGIAWQAHSAVLAFSIGAVLAIVAGWFLFLFVPAHTKEN